MWAWRRCCQIEELRCLVEQLFRGREGLSSTLSDRYAVLPASRPGQRPRHRRRRRRRRDFRLPTNGRTLSLLTASRSCKPRSGDDILHSSSTSEDVERHVLRPISSSSGIRYTSKGEVPRIRRYSGPLAGRTTTVVPVDYQPRLHRSLRVRKHVRWCRSTIGQCSGRPLVVRERSSCSRGSRPWRGGQVVFLCKSSSPGPISPLSIEFAGRASGWQVGAGAGTGRAGAGGWLGCRRWDLHVILNRPLCLHGLHTR